MLNNLKKKVSDFFVNHISDKTYKDLTGSRSQHLWAATIAMGVFFAVVAPGALPVVAGLAVLHLGAQSIGVISDINKSKKHYEFSNYCDQTIRANGVQKDKLMQAQS